MNKRRTILSVLLLAALAVGHLSGFILNRDVARGFFAVFLLTAVMAKFWEIVPVAAIYFLLWFEKFYLPEVIWRFPALPMLVPFLLGVSVMCLFPATRKELVWFRRGRVDKVTCMLIVLTGLAATSALILWGIWSDNLGFAKMMIKGLQGTPTWLLVAVVVPVFALVNAFSEEVIFRGVLQESLNKVFGPISWLTLGLQASAFAIVHVKDGFPNGVVGYVMVFSWGSMLGYLRLRTKGMLAPYLTHVLADLTIGYFLFFYSG